LTIGPSRGGAGRTSCATFATEALAAGISIFELARVMETSVKMIDPTYPHELGGFPTMALPPLLVGISRR
jgi:hypothetical protein